MESSYIDIMCVPIQFVAGFFKLIKKLGLI